MSTEMTAAIKLAEREKRGRARLAAALEKRDARAKKVVARFAYLTIPSGLVKFSNAESEQDLPACRVIIARDVTREMKADILVKCDTQRDGKDTPFVANVRIASSVENRYASAEFFRKWCAGEKITKEESDAELARNGAGYEAAFKRAKETTR